jgi:Zn-dependent protease
MSLAYVKYTAAGALQDLLIALAGPLVNVGLAVALAILYVYTPLKEKFSVKFAYFVMLVPTLMAVISNSIPISGTDGYLVLKSLSALF